MKQKEFTSTQPAPMTDEALSKRFGRMQRIEAISIIAAVIAILGCAVTVLFFRQLVLGAVLFAVAAAGILTGSSTQKKRKALMHSQLSGFFQTELEKAFGPAPQAPELPIDESFLRSSQLTGRRWEACEIRNFHEGTYRGQRFSAANVLLTHVYETRFAQDGASTNTTKMFDGIVIRCRTALRAPTRVYVRERIEPDEPDVIRSSSDTFNQRLIIESDTEGAALSLLTPQFLTALEDLEKNFRDELSGLIWENDTLTLAINTSYVFADVPDAVDARDIDALRKWYSASLRGMCYALDALIDKAPVFQQNH